MAWIDVVPLEFLVWTRSTATLSTSPSAFLKAVCTLFVLFQIREIAGKSSFISSYAPLHAPKYIVLASTKHSGALLPSLPWQEEPR